MPEEAATPKYKASRFFLMQRQSGFSARLPEEVLPVIMPEVRRAGKSQSHRLPPAAAEAGKEE